MTPADAIDEVAARGSSAASTAARASRGEWLLLAAFYVLMHGGILLIPGAVFWDDWVLYHTAPATIAEMFEDAGAMFNAVTYLHHALLGLGMWSYKVLTFGLWFATGLLLNRILARTRLFPDGARLAVVLLFLVLPFNAARVAAINFPYTLTTFFFFLAWYLMDRQRIAALALFTLGFFTPSLLMFYALPILDAAYRGGYLRSVREMLRFGVRRLDFLLLPFLFFAVRQWSFAPSGTYAGYQSNYSLRNILPSARAQWVDALDLPLRLDTLLFLALLPLVWMLLARAASSRPDDGRVTAPRLATWAALGVAAFLLGAVPYWILGLPPSFTEWASRHQLLLPLGTALLLVAAVWALPVRLRTAAMAVALAGSLSFGIGTSYAFWVDWQKQQVLIELFRRDPAIAKADFIVFVDRTRYLNAIARYYRFYEWNGLLVEAFGTEKRFGMNPREARPYAEGRLDPYMKGQYKAGGHRRTDVAGGLLVEIGEDPRTVKSGPGIGIWRWPPLPALELRTSPLSAEALRTLRGV